MTAEELDRYEEGKRLARIAVIAQMAATLKAGYMANSWNAEHYIQLHLPTSAEVAQLATALYDAVEASERARQQSHTTEDATR